MAKGIDLNFIEEINKNALFGRCNPKEFITANTERLQRERKANIERKKRAEDALLTKIEKRKQEQEDFIFASEEQQRLNFQINEDKYNSRGRGAVLYDSPQRRSPPKTRELYAIPHRRTPSQPRGRGRLTAEEKERLDEAAFFKKEMHMKNQLLLTNGAESFHSNRKQEQYWHGKKTTPPIEERFYGDSSSPSIFDDAESADGSFSTNSPADSYKSCRTTATSSPVSGAPTPPAPGAPTPPALLPTAPVSPPAVRKRGSRLAAKFSNVSLDGDSSDEACTNDNSSLEQFTVYGSAARPLAPFGLRSDHFPGAFSFNCVNSSLRMLDNRVIPPEDVYQSDTSDGSFHLRLEDFPALK